MSISTPSSPLSSNSTTPNGAASPSSWAATLPAGRGLHLQLRGARVRRSLGHAVRTGRALCPHAIWAKPSFDRYREMSQAVFAIFRDETPLVQPVSIDEAFLDVTPGAYATEHPVAVARRIRERVAKLGITASVGVATSRRSPRSPPTSTSPTD